MTHPTDAELEAMAEKVLAVDGSFAELLPAHAEEICEEAAAMLRACKGRAVKRLYWGDSNLASTPIGLSYSTAWLGDGEWTWHCTEYPYGGDSDETFACEDDAKAAAQADYERRILSALEPAPAARHEAWRAGIEAVVKVADEIDEETSCMYCCDARLISEAARALAEKGPDHD